MPKVFAVLPIYNEAKTLEGILERVRPWVDGMVLVNDGSTDATGAILDRFAKGRSGTYVLQKPRNEGMAGALRTGFLFLLFLRSKGLAGEGDLAVTIDADGQHKPEHIPALIGYAKRTGADVVLTRRDFSVYPAYKVWGNRFLTWTNSILSGTRYRDVESGLRVLRIRTLGPILDFYTGVGYSCAQEIALVSARLGFKIDNDYLVDIAYYRPGTTLWDGFTVLFMSLLAAARVALGWRNRPKGGGPFLEGSWERSRTLWRKKRGK